MSEFFIDRPIFAWVIAMVLMLFGGIAVKLLPVAQYPSIAPPSISISTTYPGASAETVQSTVVEVIEQQLSGIDHLLYFTSDSYKNGTMTITLSFAQGTDPDVAQVQVQNKVALAQPTLPTVVQSLGVTVILAHPERMRPVQADPSLADRFAEMGVLLQGNLQCFSDPPGAPTRKATRAQDISGSPAKRTVSMPSFSRQCRASSRSVFGVMG